MEYTILIADDEPLERHALHELVAQSAPGAPRIRVTEDGTGVVRLADTERIDIALLDIRMPGMTGLDAAAHLRRVNPSAAIVFLSAFDYFSYAQSALRLGAVDYLIKPVEDDAVLRVLERYHRTLVDRRPQNAVHESRFQEAARFLEYELLDDLVAGDPDLELLRRAFDLLGYGEVRGCAIVVRPSLADYAFRLRTDAQKRTVVLRVLRAIAPRIEVPGSRVLFRAHPDFGYMLYLNGDGRDDADLASRMAIGCADARERTGIDTTYATSPVCTTLEDLGTGILAARTALRDRRSTHPLDERPPASEAIVRAERYVLAAALEGNGDAVREGAAQLWDHIREHYRGTTTEVVAREADEILTFLSHSLRLHGDGSGRRTLSLRAARNLRELRGDFLDAAQRLAARAYAADRSQFAEAVHEWLQEHYAADVGLPDLARHMGISASYCSREFSRTIGSGFREYLRDIRIAAAKRLLSTTTLAVREIAEKVGFRDANYFSRVFSNTQGVSPGAFRRVAGR